MNNTISLEQAVKMTTLFREHKEIVISSDFQGRNILPVCESFERAAIDKLLSQPDCVGFRIYHGMNEESQLRSIIVGINSKNEDMLPTKELSSDDDNVIVEDGVTCPPICPPSSPLNP